MRCTSARAASRSSCGRSRASVQLRAKGFALELPALPLPASGRVVAQLGTGDGVCWSATYLASAVVNDDRRFSDSSE